MLKVKMGNGYVLCAEETKSEPGIIMYIARENGDIVQDISAAHVVDNSIIHLLYADAESEDYTQRDEIKNNEYGVYEDTIINATDYIGNEPEMYGADNHDLEQMRENNSFKEYLIKRIHDDLFCDNDQKECADYVWGAYLDWQKGAS